MKLSLGAKSLVFFALSVLFLVLITLFESALTGMSLTAERLISALLLIVPGVIGIVFGVLSMLRNEPRVWVAILGVTFNSLFVLFQTAVLFFAG